MPRWRPAGPDDIDFIAHVILEANRERLSRRPEWDPERWHAGAREVTANDVAGGTPHSVLHVIELQGEPIGRLRIVRPGDELYLGGIQLLPEHQRLGYGTAIVKALQAEAKEAGLPLRLNVETDNPDARRLYLRLGFAIVAEHADREDMEWWG